MARVLYITYDGLLEPLGQSQVWQYVRRLATEHRLFVLSFEKAGDWNDGARMSAMRAECARAGVGWIPFRYHKTPTAPATSYDIAVGIVAGLWLVVRHRIEIVHARSYVAAVIALALKQLAGPRFVFDMRGFWADERVNGGLWPANGLLYRVAKRFERRFLLEADAIVSLTRAAVAAMKTFDYLRERDSRFEVIPTCADLALFSAAGPAPSGTPFTLGYLGSVGVWYLFDDVIATFKALRGAVPDARFLVVNRGAHEQIRDAVSRAGIPSEALEIIAAAHADVPEQIRRMDACVFYYKPSFATLATAPTRLAELLAVSVPVLSNAGVGDIESIVLNDGKPVGVIVQDFSSETLAAAVRRLLELAADPAVRRRCREVAERHFSVEWASERYSSLYRELAAPVRS